jgi:hypothetical protein
MATMVMAIVQRLLGPARAAKREMKDGVLGIASISWMSRIAGELIPNGDVIYSRVTPRHPAEDGI